MLAFLPSLGPTEGVCMKQKTDVSYTFFHNVMTFLSLLPF